MSIEVENLSTQDVETKYVATWLPPEMYGLLEADFREWGVPLPDPNLSSIAIVLDTETNDLAGFICAQTVIHCEPIKVREPYRTAQGEIMKLLIGKIQEPFREAKSGFYVFVPDEKIKHLVEREGMTILPWQIAVKTFESEE